MWQPEIGPMAYARASSVSPKARATPIAPTRSLPPTAAPTASNTRRAVPRNSAASERASVRDTGDLRADRIRSPESPASATTVRAGTSLTPPAASRQGLRSAGSAGRPRRGGRRREGPRPPGGAGGGGGGGG